MFSQGRVTGCLPACVRKSVRKILSGYSAILIGLKFERPPASGWRLSLLSDYSLILIGSKFELALQVRLAAFTEWRQYYSSNIYAWAQLLE